MSLKALQSRLAKIESANTSAQRPFAIVIGGHGASSEQIAKYLRMTRSLEVLARPHYVIRTGVPDPDEPRWADPDWRDVVFAQ